MFLQSLIWMMMKYALEILIIFLITCTYSLQVIAQDIQCRPYEIIEPELDGPEKFKNGLLWGISRDGALLGYIFGTIHVDDKNILDIPSVVSTSLGSSDYFAMEVIPTPEDVMNFSLSMFFMDGSRLDTLLPTVIFNETVRILDKYSLTKEIVTVMKPWAAFIIMSYPANMDTVLDLKLLQLAQSNGAQVSGLESSREQIEIFSEMDITDQVRILVDAVCHYDTVLSDFSNIKNLYLQRDLEGLYIYGQKYLFEDNSVYEDISDKLLLQRNQRMVDRMIDVFELGKSFIAIGAMHLPGDKGVLNLLEMKKYEITLIY